MKNLLLLIPLLFILNGCSSDGQIPPPSANILDSGGNPKVDCTQMPWKTDQKLCGPGHQLAR